jgi:hypothetical protein
MLFDPYMYPTWRTHWNRYLSRLREHGARRAIAGWLLRRTRGPARKSRADLWHDRAVPGKAEFARGLMTLLERGVEIYLMYSGGRPDEYNYAGQFRDVFTRYGVTSRIRCDYLPEVNHTIMEFSAQRAICERLREWIGDLAAARKIPAAAA